MLKLNYFLADIFILSAEKQPIKLSWRKIEWLLLIVNKLFVSNILMLKYLKKCLSKKYTLILVLIFILQNIKDEYFSEWKYV